jgi:signal transduction histidine kinase
MPETRDELLLRRLSEPFERLGEVSRRHPLLTDIVLALGTAATSVTELAIQHRLRPTMLVFCLALCLPLLLCHRAPVGAYVVVALVALTQWFVSVPQLADGAVLVALYWVCLGSDMYAIVVALAATEVGAAMLALRWESQEFKYWVGVSGLTVAAAALGLVIRQRRQLLASLQERAARLERERDQQAELGAAAERARIAREMHDIVSHNLTVMIALADGARYALAGSPAEAAGAVQRISATGREALGEMRRLLGVLHGEPERGLLEPQPTLERLDDLCARVRAAGVPVSVSLDGELRNLPPGVQLTVFRVAQEALTNTLKHASRPTTAHVVLRCVDGEVELVVGNTGGGDGAGTHDGSLPMRQRTSGRGVLGMRERANAYDGTLDCGPAPGGGWLVRLRLAADAASAQRNGPAPASTTRELEPAR